MRNVIFLEKPLREADLYRRGYSQYFCELYSDTGIWSEDQIIEQYIAEADKRHSEIIQTISSRMSEESVIGAFEQTVTILWRSKKLIVHYRDEENARIIIDLKILS